LADFSRGHDLPFNIHMLETKTQRVLGIERYGKSLVRLVNDLGFLDERMLVIHAIWVDDERAFGAELRARQPEIDAAVSVTARQAARLEPYWRAMYLRAAAMDVGFTRWVGNGR